jgi:hypothetical protein
MTIPAQFDAKTIEDKWYAYWMENNYFHSEPDHRTPYTHCHTTTKCDWSLAHGAYVEQHNSRCFNSSHV